MSQTKRYKKGDAERVIYERVNNLREANINLSILFQVTQGGSLENHPTCMILPTLEESVRSTYENFTKRKKDLSEFYCLVRDHIYLDNLEWLSQVVQVDGCP